MDQHNDFRETIERGGTVVGARAATYSPALIEVYGALGIDWVWLDFEHAGPTPWDSGLFEHLTRAAEVSGTELLVRIPEVSPPLIRKVLDAGVRNLIVPRVDDAAEVRRAVEATRFEYDGDVGERGLGAWRSSAYATTDDVEYIRREDDAVCVGVIVEKRTAVENVDEILAVPDLGFVWIGVNDLCVQLGHPGNRDHPAVAETIESIERAAADAGLPLGGVAHDPDLAADLLDRGYRILRLGGELEAVQQVLRDRLDRFGELTG